VVAVSGSVNFTGQFSSEETLVTRTLGGGRYAAEATENREIQRPRWG